MVGQRNIQFDRVMNHGAHPFQGNSQGDVGRYRCNDFPSVKGVGHMGQEKLSFIQVMDPGCRVISNDGREEAVVRPDEVMFPRQKGDETSVAPDARVHDTEVDRPFWKKGEGLMDHGGGLADGAGPDAMGDIDQIRPWIDGQDDAFDHRHIGIAQTEISGQCNDA